MFAIVRTIFIIHFVFLELLSFMQLTTKIKSNVFVLMEEIICLLNTVLLFTFSVKIIKCDEQIRHARSESKKCSNMKILCCFIGSIP